MRRHGGRPPSLQTPPSHAYLLPSRATGSFLRANNSTNGCTEETAVVNQKAPLRQVRRRGLLLPLPPVLRVADEPRTRARCVVQLNHAHGRASCPRLTRSTRLQRPLASTMRCRPPTTRRTAGNSGAVAAFLAGAVLAVASGVQGAALPDSKSQNENIYDATYWSYQKSMNEFGGAFKGDVLKHFMPPSASSVLEFGSAGGYIVSQMPVQTKVGVEINTSFFLSCFLLVLVLILVSQTRA